MELTEVSMSKLFIQILQIKEAFALLDTFASPCFLLQRFIAAKNKKWQQPLFSVETEI